MKNKPYSRNNNILNTRFNEDLIWLLLTNRENQKQGVRPENSGK